MSADPRGLGTTRRHGRNDHRAGHRQPSDGRLAEPDAYWLSLLADLLTGFDRHDAARATLETSIADGLARDDVWWMPEVMRLRAPFDEREAAVDRLRSAARLASAQGSVALLQRCADDLARRGVRPVSD